MLGETKAMMLLGVKGVVVDLECDVSNGMPMFNMVGYLSSEVREARERVSAAIKNSGYRLEAKKIILNLSPAYLHKSGTGFDLACALSLLMGYGYLNCRYSKDVVLIGELGLTGELHKTVGVLPMLLEARKTYGYAMVPMENYEEAVLADGIRVFGVRTLREAISLLSGPNLETVYENYQKMKKSTIKESVVIESFMNNEEVDYGDIYGQDEVKKACLIAACGMHNLLLIGPPGSGKSLAVKGLNGILPDLTKAEQLQVTSLYSVSGLLQNANVLMTKRPFRHPHHAITMKGMSGGGNRMTPGEVSLACNGILFLDELTEFRKDTLEVLRQPLEDKVIYLSHAGNKIEYPANFTLVGAMNPCPCGFYPSGKCRCREDAVRQYLGKVSGPVLDRMDLCIFVNPLDYEEVLEWQRDRNDRNDNNEKLNSKQMKEIVLRVHEKEKLRFAGERISFNSEMTPGLIQKYCRISDGLKLFLKDYFDRNHFSMRSFHEVLKVARTIADINEHENIEENDLKDSLKFREGFQVFFHK